MLVLNELVPVKWAWYI